MIEQTELVVNEWIYMPPAVEPGVEANIISKISLEVMKKRAADKKGIACRFSCKFVNGNDTILLYVAENSYVIDLADTIDRNEVLKMIRNSYEQFKEKFELRKISTVLHDKSMIPLDETRIDVDAIVPLLD